MHPVAPQKSAQVAQVAQVVADATGEEAPVTQDHPAVAKGTRASLLHSIGMCLNPKVVLSLAAVWVGVWLLAPSIMWTVLPALVVLVCPLSMLVMMLGMRVQERQDQP